MDVSPFEMEQGAFIDPPGAKENMGKIDHSHENQEIGNEKADEHISGSDGSKNGGKNEMSSRKSSSGGSRPKKYMVGYENKGFENEMDPRETKSSQNEEKTKRNEPNWHSAIPKTDPEEIQTRKNVAKSNEIPIEHPEKMQNQAKSIEHPDELQNEPKYPKETKIQPKSNPEETKNGAKSIEHPDEIQKEPKSQMKYPKETKNQPKSPAEAKNQPKSNQNKKSNPDEIQNEPKIFPKLKKHEKSQINSEGENKTEESKKEYKNVKLQRELSLLDSVCIIMGNVIGGGIFISPRAVLQYSGSVGMSLIVWVLTGLFTLCGSFCFAELGTMIPQSGGNYTYLYEAYGPLAAFIYMWMYMTILIPGGRALSALTFANYIIQPIFWFGQDPPETSLKLVAIIVILLLTYINTIAVRWATKLQDWLCLLKVFALVVIILVGLYHLAIGYTENFETPFEGTYWDPTLLATAFYSTTYAYDGWDNLNFITEEVKNPERTLPVAMVLSITAVTIIYTLTNVSYFTVIDKQQMLDSAAVAVTFGQLALGAIAWTVPFFVSCSTAGGINGAIYTSSRMVYTSARNGHLPKLFSFVHMKNNTPVTALVLITSVSMVMFVTSDLLVLTNYLSFTNNLLGLLCISPIFYFRIKKPDLHRPFKVWLGIPIIFTIVSVFLVVFPVIQRPIEIVAALVIIITGLPIYYLCVYKTEKPRAFTKAMEKVTYCVQMIFLSVPEDIEEEEKKEV